MRENLKQTPAKKTRSQWVFGLNLTLTQSHCEIVQKNDTNECCIVFLVYYCLILKRYSLVYSDLTDVLPFVNYLLAPTDVELAKSVLQCSKCYNSLQKYIDSLLVYAY